MFVLCEKRVLTSDSLTAQNASQTTRVITNIKTLVATPGFEKNDEWVVEILQRVKKAENRILHASSSSSSSQASSIAVPPLAPVPIAKPSSDDDSDSSDEESKRAPLHFSSSQGMLAASPHPSSSPVSQPSSPSSSTGEKVKKKRTYQSEETILATNLNNFVLSQVDKATLPTELFKTSHRKKKKT